jgi:hypothetical protein
MCRELTYERICVQPNTFGLFCACTHKHKTFQIQKGRIPLEAQIRTNRRVMTKAAAIAKLVRTVNNTNLEHCVDYTFRQCLEHR